MTGPDPKKTRPPRHPQGDLAILSAEVYDPGPSFRAPRRPAVAAKTLDSAVRASEDGPRKRARDLETESGQTGDGKKKSRGRPRLELDAQDETAADRRRTQIRLAQRAYRNRKETAIQTLEKKVQQLRDTNEQMSNAFMQLHDFALSAGLLDQMPELGRQLRATTERFLELARIANDDAPKDPEESVASPSSNPGDREVKAAHSLPLTPEQTSTGSATTTPPTTATTMATAKTPTGDRRKVLYGGTIVAHEPVSQPDTTAGDPGNTVEPPTTSTHGYHKATSQPPLENAGFPSQTSAVFDYLDRLAAFSPNFDLDVTYSYCALETTFGRRLQRYAIQLALTMITMPHPPTAILSEVFGFCLLFETPEDIERRLRRLLGHNTQQSLCNWQYPFYHLGGAGTHLDTTSAAAAAATTHRIGNQGTVDVLKPNATAGFATGPFTAEVSSVRDSALGKDMRMALPGFGYEYFDCDEIEMYLLQRGVAIPPGADFVTADIDPSHFDNEAWQADPFAGMPCNVDFFSMATNPAGQEGQSTASSRFSPEPSLGSGPTLTDLSAPELDSAAALPSWPFSGAAAAGLAEPTAAGDGVSQASAFLTATTSVSPAQPTSSSTFPSPNDPNSLLGFPPSPLVGDSGIPNLDAAAPGPQRSALRRVVVDVKLLVKEMTHRSVCLGRTPGVKQDDINAAFWASVQVETL